MDASDGSGTDERRTDRGFGRACWLLGRGCTVVDLFAAYVMRPARIVRMVGAVDAAVPQWLGCARRAVAFGIAEDGGAARRCRREAA